MPKDNKKKKIQPPKPIKFDKKPDPQQIQQENS
jgi:hypothetical protein